MSDVTNLIFALSVTDDNLGKMHEVNTYFVDKGTKPLVSVDDERLPRTPYRGDGSEERENQQKSGFHREFLLR